MKTLSKGSLWALAALALITLIGAYFTFTDYVEHEDLSTIWWPIITAAIFTLTFLLSKRTDGRATTVALLLLAAGAASCSRDVAGDAVAERIAPDTVRAAYVAMPDTIVWATRTEQEGSWDATRPVKW